jgi:hypothetical protein
MIRDKTVPIRGGGELSIFRAENFGVGPRAALGDWAEKS